MTRRELMLHTLVTVTGQPRPHLEKVLDRWEKELPGPVDWNEEIPAQQREALGVMFAAEASGILARYAQLLQKHEDLQLDRAEAVQEENARRYRKVRR